MKTTKKDIIKILKSNGIKKAIGKRALQSATVNGRYTKNGLNEVIDYDLEDSYIISSDNKKIFIEANGNNQIELLNQIKIIFNKSNIDYKYLSGLITILR